MKTDMSNWGFELMKTIFSQNELFNRPSLLKTLLLRLIDTENNIIKALF